MAYDNDLKIKAMQFLHRGNSVRQTAEAFSIGHDTVSRWSIEFRQCGSFSIKVVQRSHLRKITPEKIDMFLKQNPSGNQDDMAVAFGCARPSVTIALKKFGYSKKNSQNYSRNPTH